MLSLVEAFIGFFSRSLTSCGSENYPEPLLPLFLYDWPMLPPFTTSVWPVMKDAIGDARKSAAWAMSLGSPLRPKGFVDPDSRLGVTSIIPAGDAGVLIPPGAMAFILI
jgi:hypothetical protein